MWVANVHKAGRPHYFSCAGTNRMVMSSTHSCACCSSDLAANLESEPMTCYCPLDDVLETVSKRYSLELIALLGANGPTRYSELEHALEVTSTSTLSERLTELAEAGLIERRSFDEVPPRVEYSLTPRGRELETQLQSLLAWADDGE